MTDHYIESNLRTAEASARDLLAWNSIRAEERLAGSPHLQLFDKTIKDLKEFDDIVNEFLMHR